MPHRKIAQSNAIDKSNRATKVLPKNNSALLRKEIRAAHIYAHLYARLCEQRKRLSPRGLQSPSATPPPRKNIRHSHHFLDDYITQKWQSQYTEPSCIP